MKKEIQTLQPAYFALVMATGILSIAAHLHHFEVVSNILFWINNIAFFMLLLLYALRLFFFFPDFVADLSSHAKGADFLTVVAGSCILGTEYAQGKQNYPLATALLIFALAVWVIFIYSFLAKVILKKEKPTPEAGMSGIWLLLVVSTQSLSILSGVLAPHLPLPTEVTLFISLFAFFLGVMLYLILIPIITNRLLFYPVTPEEVPPSYWINMGAAAITTLAGVLLSQSIRGNELFSDFYFFTRSTALLFWAVGTFWIPVVLILEAWRYIIKRSPIKYEPAFWSMVFPLGMYTVSTVQLAAVLHLPFLQSISKGFVYIASAAWLATFLGMLIYLLKFSGKSGRTHPVQTR